MSETVQSVINGIKENLSQCTASTKDEISVMQTMLNDKTYKVGVAIYKYDDNFMTLYREELVNYFLLLF